VNPRRSAVLAFFDLPVGTVVEVPDPPRKRPGLVVWHSPLAVGERTRPVRSVADGLAQGLVVAAGEDLDSVNEAVNDMLDAHAPVVVSS